MKNRNTRKWLLLGGRLAGCTFDLFETVAELGGVDVRFLYSPLDDLPSYQHERTGAISSGRLWWEEAGWYQIREFVRDPTPDVAFVYGNHPRIKMAYALSCLPGSVPVYYVADTNIAKLAASGGKTLVRRIACLQVVTRAAAALSLGQSNRLALQLLGFQRIVDLPALAVDFEALDRAVAKVTPVDFPEPRREITLLVIARLVPEKNLPAFVGALAAEPELVSRVRLIIAGEGPDRPALESIKARSPSLDLVLLGAVPHAKIGPLFACADALLLPSRSDAWGAVVVEALGMGLPVIATPEVGAAVSLAGETQTILLSESADPRSLLDTIRIFGKRRAALSGLASMARQAIRSRYGRPEVASAHLELVYGPHFKKPE
jgi:glycosyltransferase involved in cell wall biosynthesis